MEEIAAFTASPNLFVVNLAAGDHPGFDIDFPGWTGNQIKKKSSDWLSQGFDGVLFQGAGVGATRIRPQADDCIFVGPHNGIVAFKDLSIGCKSVVGKGKALHMGLANPSGPVNPNFMASLENVEVYAEGPAVWGLFGYQCDWSLKNVTFNLAPLHEHGLYAHGFARQGAYVERLTVNGVGAECLKFTARPSESRWVKGAAIQVRNSTFKNWAQPWSWRGGAGFTAQGSSANILIENCRFYGGTTMDRGHCIMFDDSGKEFYGFVDGVPGVGPANGHILIRNTGCALNGVSDPWNNNISWVGSLDQSRTPPITSAKSLTVDGCGYYGKNTLWNVSGRTGDLVAGRGTFSNCNTPQIRQLMANLGFRVDEETKIAGPGGLTPLSAGLSF